MKKASSSVALLDVNVLLALAWPNHQFHAASVKRLSPRSERWATCAITQLGFIRLSSNSSAVSSPRTPAEAADLLSDMLKDPAHVYLGRVPSPLESCRFDRVHGSGQVTDAYLLAIARENRASFLTFDTRIRALAQGHVEVEVLGA